MTHSSKGAEMALAEKAVAKLASQFPAIAEKMDNHMFRNQLQNLIAGFEKETVTIAIRDLVLNGGIGKYDNPTRIVGRHLREAAHRKWMASKKPVNERTFKDDRFKALAGTIASGGSTWGNRMYVKIPKAYDNIGKMMEMQPDRFEDHPTDHRYYIYRRFSPVEKLMKQMRNGCAPSSLRRFAINHPPEDWQEAAEDFARERKLPGLVDNYDEVTGQLPKVKKVVIRRGDSSEN